MVEELLKLDLQLFQLINSGCQNRFFDGLLPLVRNSLFWVPLYLFLIVFGFVNYRKNVWWWILFAILTVWMTDFLSSNIIKENIFRLRPCNDPAAMARLLVSYCPQSSSFTSSHATNHFGLASFLYFTLRDLPRRWRLALFAWAFLVIFAQVYVGVHYPLDVIFGGLIGFVFGYLPAKAFNRAFGLS